MTALIRSPGEAGEVAHAHRPPSLVEHVNVGGIILVQNCPLSNYLKSWFKANRVFSYGVCEAQEAGQDDSSHPADCTLSLGTCALFTTHAVYSLAAADAGIPASSESKIKHLGNKMIW